MASVLPTVYIRRFKKQDLIGLGTQVRLLMTRGAIASPGSENCATAVGGASLARCGLSCAGNWIRSTQ